MSVFTRAIKPTAAPGRNCEIAIEAGTARLFNLIFMTQFRRRCVSLQIDNLENRSVRLLDFSLTKEYRFFEDPFGVSQHQPSTESRVLHAEVSLRRRRSGYANCISNGAVLRDHGLVKAGVDFE